MERSVCCLVFCPSGDAQLCYISGKRARANPAYLTQPLADNRLCLLCTAVTLCCQRSKSKWVNAHARMRNKRAEGSASHPGPVPRLTAECASNRRILCRPVSLNGIQMTDDHVWPDPTQSSTPTASGQRWRQCLPVLSCDAASLFVVYVERVHTGHLRRGAQQGACRVQHGFTGTEMKGKCTI